MKKLLLLLVQAKFKLYERLKSVQVKI